LHLCVSLAADYQTENQIVGSFSELGLYKGIERVNVRWPIAAFGQDQKSEDVSSEARGRGGLGALIVKV
jgi:hypothetical protein